MNNVFPKFIVTLNNNNQKIIIYGKCTYHKELKPNENSIVLGGGFFYYKDSSFILYGNSSDFGKATSEDVR